MTSFLIRLESSRIFEFCHAQYSLDEGKRQSVKRSRMADVPNYFFFLTQNGIPQSDWEIPGTGILTLRA